MPAAVRRARGSRPRSAPRPAPALLDRPQPLGLPPSRAEERGHSIPVRSEPVGLPRPGRSRAGSCGEGPAMRLRDLLEERLALMAPARRLRLALADVELRRRVGPTAATLIDAGAGDGLLTLALAKRHPGWRLLGLDLRDDMLNGARERAAGGRLGNVEFAP